MQTYAAGERIFEEGMAQAFFYVIVAGRAALSQRIGWSKLAPFGRVGGSVVDQLASLVQTEQRLQVGDGSRWLPMAPDGARDGFRWRFR